MCFTSTLGLLALISVAAWLSFGGDQRHTVSLMTYKFKHDFPMRHRSNALSKKTVALKSGNSLSTPLCIRRNGVYKIVGVSYSNDGGADVISVSLNSKTIGSFVTSKAGRNDGTLWNVFHKSGHIGTSMNLIIGTYQLGIHVESADLYGIEIDAILIETTDLTLGEELLECKVHCLPSHQSEMNVFNSAIMPMQIVQRSFKTKCAEQDNIDVPMFHENVNSYEIVATYPKYNFSFNTRDAIFENCETLSPQLLWRLKTKPFDLAQKVKTNLDSFELNLASGEPFIINIKFQTKGKLDGLIDSDIGSVLKVDFHNVLNDFNVSCRYITREGRFSAPTQSLVTKEQQTFKCTMPDYTWTEHEINAIQLNLTSSLNESVKIDTIELSRRHEYGQTKKVIHEDGDTVIQGRNVDFWWRRPRTMKVKIRNETFEEIDFIVIYKRIPTTSRFNQVLVMYEDGNFRILPLPPKDIDWTPFGSSMIIGQSKITSFRPVAEISLIEIISIETNTIQIRLHYFDGGSAIITINTAGHKTVLHVSQLNFKRSLKEYPFARFRSMWVRDGNCDVDHLKVNGGKNKRILEPWNKLSGNVVEFFRLCESMHLNLSPDIALKVLN